MRRLWLPSVLSDRKRKLQSPLVVVVVVAVVVVVIVVVVVALDVLDANRRA